nr:MATE family efflux transporter [Gehongia tenuis]
MSNLLQVVYNMVDMVVVGQFVGSAGLSAVSIGGDVLSFLTFIAMGFASAGQVIISQYIGAERRERVGRLVGTMTTFLMACAVILSVVCFIIRTPILQWMNTPPEAWDNAMSYAVTSMAGLIFIYGYNTVSAVLRGMGDSRHPFIFVAAAAVLNLVLDLVFVAGLGMEAFGAALATVIGQGLSFVAAAVFLYRRRQSLGFSIRAKDFLPDRTELSTLLKLGVPMAIKSAAVHFSKLFVNSYINSYGVAVSAVAGIGNKLSTVSNLISNSVNAAGSSMVGQNIGAEKYERVPKILSVSFILCAACSAVMAAVILIFPSAVFGIFSSDPAVLAVCMQYIPVAVLVFASTAFRSPMNAFINGSGNYRLNFAVALLDGILARIGIALLMGVTAGMGYLGFWYGDAIAGFVPFFIGGVYYLTGKWKTRKYILQSE